MINLQLYVEIMRLGAEGRGREEQGDFSQSSGWGEAWQGAGKAQKAIRDLSQARQDGGTGAALLGWRGFNEAPQFLPTHGLLDGKGLEASHCPGAIGSLLPLQPGGGIVVRLLCCLEQPGGGEAIGLRFAMNRAGLLCRTSPSLALKLHAQWLWETPPMLRLGYCKPPGVLGRGPNRGQHGPASQGCI